MAGPMMPVAFHVIALSFLFAFGACAGSFLNVVVLRIPETPVPDDAPWWRAFWLQLRGVTYPPSHCPRCGKGLKWHDNFPIFGWLWLGGKCRNCKLPISPRYPIVELATALLFAGLYVSVFLLGPTWGPPTPAVELAATNAYAPWDSQVTRDAFSGTLFVRKIAMPLYHWPALAILLGLAWCLLAASMIDAEHFHIPRGLSYLPAVWGVALHAAFIDRNAPLDLSVGPIGCAYALGGGVGLLLSLGLLRFRVLRRSFENDLPLLEIERVAAGQDAKRTPEEEAAEAKLVRREMVWEVGFLLPPIVLAIVAAYLATGPMAATFDGIANVRPMSSALGAVLGGLVGGGVIWAIRLFGSLAFGREAMGLGDADLMFGVGCCIGAGPAAIAVFPAALLGLGFAVVRVLTKSLREMPFGPYLAAASLILVVVWNPLADYLRPSLEGLGIILGPAAPYLGL